MYILCGPERFSRTFACGDQGGGKGGSDIHIHVLPPSALIAHVKAFVKLAEVIKLETSEVVDNSARIKICLDPLLE